MTKLLCFCDALQNPEDYPEYPKISRKYYVEFLFINDDVNEPPSVESASLNDKVKVIAVSVCVSVSVSLCLCVCGHCLLSSVLLIVISMHVAVSLKSSAVLSAHLSLK